MRTIIFITLLWAISAISANAQYFIEGSAGVDYSNHEGNRPGEDGEEVFDNNNFSFSVNPKIGYWLSDAVAVGVFPSFGLGYTKDQGIKNTKWHQLGFAVFGRYKLWNKEKFSLLLENPIGIYNNEYNTDSGIFKNSEFVFRANLYPLVSYDINERFSITAICNFLNLGFISSTKKYPTNDAKETINTFDFNARSSLLNSLGNISIGLTYNFKNKSK